MSRAHQGTAPWRRGGLPGCWGWTVSTDVSGFQKFSQNEEGKRLGDHLTLLGPTGALGLVSLPQTSPGPGWTCLVPPVDTDFLHHV